MKVLARNDLAGDELFGFNRKYCAKIERLAILSRTGINGALGLLLTVFEANRRPAWRAVFCMELMKAFMMVNVLLK